MALHGSPTWMFFKELGLLLPTQLLQLIGAGVGAGVVARHRMCCLSGTLPAAHAVHAAAPSTRATRPVAQCEHCVRAPCAACARPGLHLKQRVPPDSGWKLPLSHRKHEVRALSLYALLLYLPGGHL